MDVIHFSKLILIFVLASLYHDIPIELIFPHDSYYLRIYVGHTVYFLLLFWVLYKFAKSYKRPKVPDTDFSVCIIGAGVSGICAAIKLKEIGVKFRIIEKNKELGGTWWENQYPGCGCDVNSHLYSFSFELNPDWSTGFSGREEIWRYLQHVADKYGITQHIEFGKSVSTTVWNKENDEWIVTLDNGEVFSVNVLVPCLGQLNVPRIPEFPGLERFRGEAFHSARWHQDYDPTGRTVAVIGTGASAVQIVPSIAPKVKQLYVFQRSPCWVAFKNSGVYPRWLRLLFRIYPPLMYLLRLCIYWYRELSFFAVFRTDVPLGKVTKKIIEATMRRAVKDPALADKLIPKYDLACKRVTPSDNYLQTFNRENVKLVTDPIKGLTEEGIETEDGTEYNVDTVVYAIGFYPYKSYHTLQTYGLLGQKGISLQEEWGDTPTSYLGLTYPGYPNMFLMYGMGSNLGHHSVIHIVECQATYLCDAISQMIERSIKSVDLKKEVHDGYQEWAQKCMQNKAFNSPTCSSWYRNSKGVNYVLYPNCVTQFWWYTRKADLGKYHCRM